MKYDRDPSSLCLAHSAAGERCRMYPRIGAEFCINHDPLYQAQMAENRSRGTKQFVENCTEANAAPIPNLPFNLGDRSSIQAAIDAVLRLTLNGTITESRAREVFRGLALASRNASLPRDARAVDRDNYKAARDLILAILDPAPAPTTSSPAPRPGPAGPASPQPSATIEGPPAVDPSHSPDAPSTPDAPGVIAACPPDSDDPASTIYRALAALRTQLPKDRIPAALRRQYPPL